MKKKIVTVFYKIVFTCVICVTQSNDVNTKSDLFVQAWIDEYKCNESINDFTR